MVLHKNFLNSPHTVLKPYPDFIVKKSAKERTETAKRLALETGISLKLLERHPLNVSGGQKWPALSIYDGHSVLI